MPVKDLFILSKGTKVILLITFIVSLLTLTFAFFYYRNINRSEDPRIQRAREFMLQYDKIPVSARSFDAFPLLDSAAAVFRSLPDYANSFENGLIFNNKSSTLLVMALYDSTLQPPEKITLLTIASAYCDSSIILYERWINEWGELSLEAIADKIRPFMKEDDPAFAGLNFQRIFSRRVRNIVMAQVETPRRLSVSLTNKGTIFRHTMQPDSSLICYRQALRLWKDNRTAASNLQVLLGGEPVKPSLIQSLYPPDRKKE
jgi:tetratricopeptide (TPR) repeat protein